MDNALVGLVGTVVGTLLGFGLKMWSDEVQWRREDRVRFHPDRLRVYANYLTATNKMAFGQTDPDFLEDLWRAHHETHLLSTWPVHRAAVRLFRASRAYAEIPAEARSDTDTSRLATASGEFMTAAQSELGVWHGRALRPWWAFWRPRDRPTEEDLQILRDWLRDGTSVTIPK